MKSRKGVGEILHAPYLPHTVRYQPSSSGNILPSSPAIPHHIGRVVRKQMWVHFRSPKGELVMIGFPRGVTGRSCSRANLDDM